MATVFWTDPALDLLVEILRDVSRRSPAQAARLRDQIFQATDNLIMFPSSRRTVPEHKLADVREILVQNYRVFYRVTDDEVEVLAIQHGALPLAISRVCSCISLGGTLATVGATTHHAEG